MEIKKKKKAKNDRGGRGGFWNDRRADKRITHTRADRGDSAVDRWAAVTRDFVRTTLATYFIMGTGRWRTTSGQADDERPAATRVISFVSLMRRQPRVYRRRRGTVKVRQLRATLAVIVGRGRETGKVPNTPARSSALSRPADNRRRRTEAIQ